MVAPMGEGRAREALAAFGVTARSPNLRRVQLSFGAAWVAEWALTVALGILAFREGGAAAVGIVATIRMLPAAILAPIGAVVVDRYRRERVLVIVCLIRGVALLLAALAVAELDSPVPAYALAAVATVVHTLYRPAHSALLPSLCCTPTELTSANVVRGLLDSASVLIAGLAAGALVGPIGVGGVFALAGASALWAGYLIARVEYESAPRIEETAASGRVAEMLDGLMLIRRDASVAVLTLLACLQAFTRGCLTVFSVLVALELLGTGEAGVGILTAAFGVGAVLGSFATSLLTGRSGFARWFGIGVALWGLPFVLLAPVSLPLIAYILLALVGVANAIVDVTIFTVIQRIVPDEVLGRYFGAFEALVTLAVAVGSLAAAGLVGALGLREALVVAGLVGPVGVLLTWRRLKHLDHRLSVSDELIATLQQTSMLRPLPIGTIARLADNARTLKVTSGTRVIEQGGTGDDFFVIAAGRAEVLRGQTSLCVLEAGDCFGEIAALGRTVRTSTVRADTDLRLLCLTGQHFVRAVTGYTPSKAVATELVQERLSQAPVVDTRLT